MDCEQPQASASEATVRTSIETREVFRVTAEGLCLRGTFHRPQGGGRADKRTGVLFLNHGFLPRSAPADSAVYWADSLAKLGYPCFRVDLPGLGDSDGEVTAKWLDAVNAGEFSKVLSRIVDDVIHRFALSGVVVAGHCAGAVTALFAAAINKDCKGLILTDPYFHLARERMHILMELRYWASWSRLGALASTWYDELRHLRLRIRGNQLPRNANLPLLSCWAQLAMGGMPILILKAPVLKGRGIKPRVGDFDYLGYLEKLSGPGSRVMIQLVDGTNHSFANSAGRESVREQMNGWMKIFFPAAEGEDDPAMKSLTAGSPR